MATRKELLAALRPRYQRATRAEKSAILDELVAVSGFHRKHATRLLLQRGSEPRARPVRKIYDEAVRQVMVVLWEASDRICGKRLKVMIPCLLESLERHGHLALAPEVRVRVLAASPATIDRLLRSTRDVAHGDRRRRRAWSSSAVRRRVPVRTSGGWDDPEPGFFEVDFVAHCGGRSSGPFLHTLVVTDIASGWTEGLPMLARQQDLVVHAFQVFREQLPIPMLGIDTDNDSAFINTTVIDFCQAEGIVATRSRPYRSNDQAWVEQKNGAVVRRAVGYERFQGITEGQLLGRVLQGLRLYVNYFQPSFKLREKQRIGARVVKHYHPPATPCDRLLADPRVVDDAKERLREERDRLDPVVLLRRIRAAQQALADREETTELELAHDTETFARFLASLPELWRSGEVSPPHKRRARPPRTYRTRPDVFVDVWPQVLLWLDAEPDANSRVLLERLQQEHPGTFKDGALRTLQRRVRGWRRERARELVESVAGTSTDDAGA